MIRLYLLFRENAFEKKNVLMHLRVIGDVYYIVWPFYNVLMKARISQALRKRSNVLIWLRTMH